MSFSSGTNSAGFGIREMEVMEVTEVFVMDAALLRSVSAQH